MTEKINIHKSINEIYQKIFLGDKPEKRQVEKKGNLENDSAVIVDIKKKINNHLKRIGIFLYNNKAQPIDRNGNIIINIYTEGMKLHMGDKIKTTGQKGDNILGKDHSHINTLRIDRPEIKNLLSKIYYEIKQNDSDPKKKEDALEQFEKLNEELKEETPDKGRIKRAYDYITRALPKVAERVPWEKLFEKVF